MNYSHDFSSLIKRYYQLSYSKEKTTQILCQKYDLQLDKINRIQKWIENEEPKKSPLDYKNKGKYVKLLTAITSGYLVYEKAIYFDEDYYPFNVIKTSSRYGFKMSYNNLEHLVGITLFDHFHGKEKFFPLDTPIEGRNNDSYYQLDSIDDYHFLVSEKSNRFRDPCRLYLLQIDWQGMECKILDQLELEMTQAHIYFDHEDRTRFVISIPGGLRGSNRGRINFVLTWMGQIKDNKILIDEIDYPHEIGPICNDYTQGKYIVMDKEEWNDFASPIKCWVLNTVDGSRFEFNFDCAFDLKKKQFRFLDYSWKDNCCYMVVSGETNQLYSQVACFNMDTKLCTLLDYKIQVTWNNSCYVNVDPNYVLSIQCSTAVYRFSLRNPQPLQTLCWFAIRRKSRLKEDNKKLYEYAVEKLPINSNFREFVI